MKHLFRDSFLFGAGLFGTIVTVLRGGDTLPLLLFGTLLGLPMFLRMEAAQSPPDPKPDYDRIAELEMAIYGTTFTHWH